MIETVIKLLLSVNDKRYADQLRAIELADNAFLPDVMPDREYVYSASDWGDVA